MDLISEIVKRAKANKQRIVLPEGTEERTLKAANQILTDGVADAFFSKETFITPMCENGFHIRFRSKQILA